MNKLFVLMLLLLIISLSFVGAEQGSSQQTQTQPGPGMAGNVSELEEIIATKNQEMEQQITQNMGEEQQLRIQNQNRVRLAVHSFLAMEYMLGGIGPNVSDIARGFDNSLQSTVESEDKISKRSAFTRFFAGGDEVAAEEIEEEVLENEERIQELKRLMNECDCEEAVKTQLQEQIGNLEQEQIRLRELATKEKRSKGMFGWLWK